MRFSITCSGQTQPLPPVSIVPRTRSFTPLQLFAYLSGISSTFGFSLENLVELVCSGPFRHELSHLGDRNDRRRAPPRKSQVPDPRFASGLGVCRQNRVSFVRIEPCQRRGKRRLYRTPPFPVTAIFINSVTSCYRFSVCTGRLTCTDIFLHSVHLALSTRNRRFHKV